MASSACGGSALGASDGGSLAAMAAGKFVGREGSKHHHHDKEKEDDVSKYRLVFSPRQDLEGREAAYAQWRRGNGEERLMFSGDASLYKSGTLEVVDGSVIPLALLAKEYEQYLRAEMGLRGVSVPAGAQLGARDSPVVRGGEPRPTVELEGVADFSENNDNYPRHHRAEPKTGLLDILLTSKIDAAPPQKHDWAIAIESKINSAEGDGQLDKYSTALGNWWGCGEKESTSLRQLYLVKDSSKEVNVIATIATQLAAESNGREQARETEM
jgi:hypothetical protein